MSPCIENDSEFMMKGMIWLMCVMWFVIYDMRHWAYIYETKMIYALYSSKRFSKVSLIKSSTYVLSFSSPSDQALKPSKKGWDGLLCEETK